MERLDIILIVALSLLIIYIFTSSNKSIRSIGSIENFTDDNYNNDNDTIIGLGSNTNYEMVSNLFSININISPHNLNIYLKPYSSKHIIGQVIYTQEEENHINRIFMVINDYPSSYKLKLKLKKYNQDSIAITDNTIESNNIHTELETFTNYLSTHLFYYMNKLDTILPKIKNIIDILISNNGVLINLKERILNAQSRNNNDQVTSLNRRLNSLEIKIIKNICHLQYLILNNPNQVCNSIDFILDEDQETLSTILDEFNTTDIIGNNSRPTSSIEYINNFNYEVRLGNKINELIQVASESSEGLVYLVENLFRYSSTEINQTPNFNLDNMININNKHTNILGKLSKLKKQKNKILKEIDELSSTRRLISNNNSFYQMQVVSKDGSVTSSYAVLGDYIGIEDNFDENGILKSEYNSSLAIIPKHCCVWKRPWEDSDIIYSNTTNNGTIKIYKNPYTNTFRITTDGESPKEQNLEVNGIKKDGVYKFVACPDKNKKLTNDIIRFNTIRNSCSYLKEETQKVNLADDEIGIETESEAMNRIRKNNNNIKNLEDTIKRLHLHKARNTIVKQNNNRIKLTEVNRKLEMLNNQLTEKIKNINNNEYELDLSNINKEDLRILLIKIFNKIKNSNIPNKRETILRINTYVKLNYLSDDDVRRLLNNISNADDVCSDIIDQDKMISLQKAQSCYKCSILDPTGSIN